MMKKMLILMLVLGMASLANATLMLSFDGALDVEEAVVAPSDYFVIDVWQDFAQPDEFWVCITGPASATGLGTLYSPPAPSTMIVVYEYECFHGKMPEPSTTGGIGKWWEIELHCEGPGDVVIDLYAADGSTIIDTIVVHQIPEPATIALLGLGGLLLRRRK